MASRAAPLEPLELFAIGRHGKEEFGKARRRELLQFAQAVVFVCRDHATAGLPCLVTVRGFRRTALGRKPALYTARRARGQGLTERRPRCAPRFTAALMARIK